MFWYLLSRNRSISGIPPYVRATANPVPPEDKLGGWLAKLLQWWWDPDTGYPIEERSGLLRWFYRRRDSDRLSFSNTRAEAIEVCTEEIGDEIRARGMVKSLTFIGSSLSDNPALMERDPGYMGRLEALPLVERERLLGGNWKIRPAAGMVFNRAGFQIVEHAPAAEQMSGVVRYWDKAGTPAGGDWSAGVKMGEFRGSFYILDSVRGQWGALDREQVLKQTAQLDGRGVDIWVEQEGGSGGKESAESTIKNLAGYVIREESSTGSKLERARSFAAQVQASNVFVLAGPWNEAYISELHNFTGDDGGLDDQTDASSGAFHKLAEAGEPWIA